MNQLQKIMRSYLSRDSRQHRRQSDKLRSISRNLAVEQLEDRILLTTFTVDSVADVSDSADGMFTLREAIEAANLTAVSDTVNFNIGGGGAQTIQVQSALPDIVNPLIINGQSQPGFSGRPLIELDGSAAGMSGGLVINGGNSIVRGLVINNFELAGITLSTAGGNLVQSNYIGTDSSGTIGAGNLNGVRVEGGSAANTIGGGSPALGNIISGNVTNGVVIADAGSDGNIVTNNIIGLGATGGVVSNGGHGVQVFVGPNDNQIGVPNQGNTISGNLESGVNIYGTSSKRNIVQGNRIGVGTDGLTPAGNGENGVLLQGSNLQGDPPTLIYVVDVSGSTSGTFIGTDVGDVNGDGDLNTVLDAEIAGLIQFTEQLNALGVGDIVQVGVVAFDHTATTLDLDPFRFGAQIATNLGADTNVDGKLDIVAALESLRSSGGTDFGVALQEALNDYALIGTGIGEGNLIFVSDGANGGGSFQPQIDALDNLEVSRVAVGVGAGASLFDLQLIDPDAETVLSSDELSDVLLEFIGLPSASGGGQPVSLTESETLVGGLGTGQGNIIAHNGLDGVRVFDILSFGNEISGNSIYSNTRLGIDLGKDGVSTNDAGDRDKGQNLRQNFPVIQTAGIGFDESEFTGTISSLPNETYRLEFFLNDSSDPSGFGEGKTFFHSINVTTSASGFANWSFEGALLPFGQIVTATATDSNGNTSEFARNAAISSFIVDGTSGDDVFTAVVLNNRIDVGVNGFTRSLDRLPAGGDSVTFDGLGGNDIITVTGTTGHENAVFGPETLAVAGPGYDLFAVDIDQIIVHANTGSDTATFNGSTGNDTLATTALVATMTGSGFSNRANGFRTILAHGNGGNDSANLAGTNDNDTVVASPFSTALLAPVYSVTANNFADVVALGLNGNNTASVDGSSGADSLTAAPDSALLTGNGFSVQLVNFPHLVASGIGGNDTLDLTGSNSADTFVSTQAQASLSGAGYSFDTSDFETVVARGLNGNDQARLDGTDDSEQLTGSPTFVQLSASQRSSRAEGFETVVANASGGNDSASLAGSNGNDLFEFALDAASLSGNGFSIETHDFESVAAAGSAGTDTATLTGSNINDHLQAVAGSATLSGEGFSGSVESFENITVDALGGEDTATLTGSASADQFVASPNQAVLSGPGYTVEINRFEDVTARGTGGRDTAVVSSLNGNDHFAASSSAASLNGRGFAIRTSEFEHVTANAGSGVNTAALAGSSSSDQLAADPA